METSLPLLGILLIALALPSLSDPAEPNPGVVGARKLATAVDCSGAVAFSAAGVNPSSTRGQLSYQRPLNDRGVGWSLETGEFTCHCPGLYHFAFSGYGEKPDTRLMLKKRVANTTEWTDVVAAGGPHSGGGSSVALLDLEVGDVTAVFLQEGNLLQDTTSASFSGYRIIKK
ncbi:cerebellin-3-like [Macrosteles quadrilineatus]|uniref:cerebellin-3-like n=1 Tax=Macrosteles quadrilineatus TaxID=74068 RepID=UPI0023E1100A|nr:cerebellin-3-like [Macrosteles quadrilineatus]